MHEMQLTGLGHSVNWPFCQPVILSIGHLVGATTLSIMTFSTTPLSIKG